MSDLSVIGKLEQSYKSKTDVMQFFTGVSQSALDSDSLEGVHSGILVCGDCITKILYKYYDVGPLGLCLRTRMNTSEKT